MADDSDIVEKNSKMSLVFKSFPTTVGFDIAAIDPERDQTTCPEEITHRVIEGGFTYKTLGEVWTPNEWAGQHCQLMVNPGGAHWRFEYEQKALLGDGWVSSGGEVTARLHLEPNLARDILIYLTRFKEPMLAKDDIEWTVLDFDLHKLKRGRSYPGEDGNWFTFLITGVRC